MLSNPNLCELSTHWERLCVCLCVSLCIHALLHVLVSLCRNVGRLRERKVFTHRERKGPPIVSQGSLGPDEFKEAVYEFPVQGKSDFTHKNPLEDMITGEKISQNAAIVRTA